ncbi:MAG: aminodeoxychorismate/anthranilate synthase component II [Clostridiales Family XIII bacterium]|jgi:anthranilate synthase component 2|nr:aminodeoxychorismate/anthranilate synthase component II [Clostridiales Family XIII bacterium]
MILLIDNYDSFSYNLYQLVGTLDSDIRVVRNDEMSAEDIEAAAPRRLILSPGPGRPSEAGVCEEAVLRFAGRIPILGVCLGHQAICEAFGARVSHAKAPMHGKPSRILLSRDCPLFAGLPEAIEGARYHSLVALRDTIPDCLAVTARTEDGEVMGVAHRAFAVYGLQFHPESVLTPEGMGILRNFLNIEEAGQ